MIEAVMGLLREDGSPKPAAHRFAAHTPELGICQWFHFEDHRLEQAVLWLRVAAAACSGGRTPAGLRDRE